MSMKKAFDQTIRDLKREVNKKILKVPSIEQKVLDATSNEPWGPHGSILADIAHASRNYHEYQMVMTVIWKRINDIGKNWRHVYKALTVLEYLVAHGSERAIDEIREHAYQISTLSDFQYIDTSGTDQGNNVRRKSESLVLLVNDKERIQEVREKAATNRDKFRSTSAVGSMYRPGSEAYGDDRFEDRCGYGRDKDDERYGRYGDSYSREGDRYGRDSREHYARDMYRDDDSRGRSRSLHYQYGPRSQSADRDIDRAYDDDDRHSARESSYQPENDMQNGRPLERKFSEQNLSAPPSYEEAVGDTRVPTFGERDGEIPAGSAPQSSSSVADTDVQSSSPTGNVNHSQATGEHGTVSHPNMAADGFDEFDPRGSAAAAPTTTPPPAPSSSNNAEIDLFGSLSEVLSPNPLAVMPVSSGATEQADAINTASDTAFTAATSRNDASTQSFADPFGESPFKAILSDDPPAAQPQNSAPVSSFQPAANSVEHMQLAAQKLDTTANVDFPEALAGIDYAQTAPGAQYPTQDAQPSQDLDILAGILPPSGPLPSLASSFSVSTGTPLSTSQTIFPSLSQTPAVGFMPQSAPSPTPFQQMAAQNMNIPSSLYQQTPYLYPSQLMSSNMGHQAQTGSLGHQNSGFLGDSLPQTGPTIPSSSQSASMSPLDLVHHQPSIEKQKFEPKSAVWADTLSKGLVDFNISGPKCNPTADIGVDFESLNRKEKRMEKPSIAPTTSTVSMGKAMGLGSGIGRAGAGAIRPPSNPIMGPGMMGVGMGPGMGMRGYGSMNQQPMGMGMGMGMRQGGVTQPPNGAPHGASMGSYNPIMGRSGYTQQPYGGGYR